MRRGEIAFLTKAGSLAVICCLLGVTLRYKADRGPRCCEARTVDKGLLWEFP